MSDGIEVGFVIVVWVCMFAVGWMGAGIYLSRQRRKLLRGSSSAVFQEKTVRAGVGGAGGPIEIIVTATGAGGSSTNAQERRHE